jgi:hypothetical protein
MWLSGKHGCLDALCFMQQLLSRVQCSGSVADSSEANLWATFVDFRKAFDLVRRHLLVDRCRQMGVHVPFHSTP